MADWAQLPRELLDLISQHLDTEFDLLRFRSVCSSWRFSVSSLNHIHPHFSILPNEGITNTSWGFFLSIRTIFALSLPQFDKTAHRPHITGSVKHPMQSAEPDFGSSQFVEGEPSVQDSIITGSRDEGLMYVASQFDKGKFSARDSDPGELPEEGPVYENLPEIDLPDLDRSWIIKIEQDDHDLTHLLYPLSRSPFQSLPDDFPKTLDLMKFRVSELGHEYILQYIDYRPFATSIRNATDLYMEKVALGVDSRKGYVLLTIHVSGKLALFRIGDKRWTLINDFPSPYDDVISFRGRFYAVDNNGRTVIVNVDSPTPGVELVANPVFGGDKKALVVSCGELLMVDTYLSIGPEDDIDFVEELDFYEEADCPISERTVRFKVFRLDQREQIWVEVKDLEDRMLFLGDYSTFSASALDFSGCKGNRIIFAEHNFHWGREEDGAMKGRGIGVFDLESGSIGPLAKCPGYFKLFWPPPSWVSSTMLEDGLNHLGI